MHDLTEAVERAKRGDLNAFITIVRRFQDMAVGYAYSILGDFGLAEDAAQEAFLQAYRDLRKLRHPHAFSSWFRKIVFTQCHRILRRNHIPTVPFEEAAAMTSRGPDPATRAEMHELRRHVLAAIRALRQEEGEVTSLFYIDGYSMAEVGEFLGVPVSTVKSRLHSARSKLKERMMDTVADTLKQNAPDPDRLSDHLVFRWKLDIGAEMMCLDGNRALVACSSTVLLAKRQPRQMPELIAIDGETGTVRWSRRCWIACFGFAEALDGDTFYVGDAGGACLALNIQDGSEFWRSGLPDKITTAVAMDHDRVYFGADKFLYALDRADGSLVWKAEMPDLSLVATPIAVGESTVTVLHQHNIVQTYAADTGDLLWKYALDTPHWTVLIASAQMMYAAAEDGLYALDLMTGELRWRKGEYTGMIYDREGKMPHFRVAPGRFAAFHEDTGEPEQTIELPGDGKGEISAGRIYLVNDNSCFVISREHLSLLWQFAADSALHAPAVVGELVYLLSVKGILYGFPGPAEMCREKLPGTRERLMEEAQGHAKAGKRGAAIAAYQKVIEDVEPGSPEAWFGVARVQEEAGKQKEAVGAWRRCLELLDRGDERLQTARQHLSALDGSLWVNKSCMYTDHMHVDAGVVYVFGDGNVFLMDSSTGDDLRMKVLGEGLCGQRSCFTDDLILVPVFSTGVNALDRETLDVRWEIPTGAGVCNVAVAEQVAYVTCWNSSGKWEGGGVTKVKLTSGEVLWEREIGSIGSPPTIVAGMVFTCFAEGDVEGGMYALSAKDGTTRWVRKDAPGRMACQSTIVERNGILYANADSPDAAVYALDMESGEIVWKCGIAGTPCSCVVVCEGTVYTATRNTLYGIDAASGEIRWKCPGLEKVAWLTHIERAGRYALLGGEDAVHVVDVETGQPVPGVTFEGQRLWQYCVEGDVLYVALEHLVKALPFSTAIGQSSRKHHQG